MDDHAADLFELVKQYGELEFQRGQKLAEIALHLRIRAVAADPPAAATSLNHQPIIFTPGRKSGPRRDLRGAIFKAVDELGALTVQQLAETVAVPVNNVRSTAHKMVAQGLLVKDGKTYRRQHPV